MNKDKQIEQERYDMAKIMADNFHINGEKWDDSDFEWTAHCLQMEGYHKQSEGKWVHNEDRSAYEAEYFCSECLADGNNEGDEAFCWNCGAKMKGGE